MTAQSTQLYKVSTFTRVWVPGAQEHLPGRRIQVEMMDAQELAALFNFTPDVIDQMPKHWAQEVPGGHWLAVKRIGVLHFASSGR